MRCSDRDAATRDPAGAGHTRRNNIIDDWTNRLLFLFLIPDDIFRSLFAGATVAFGRGAGEKCWKKNNNPQSLVRPSSPERSASKEKHKTHKNTTAHNYSTTSLNSARWTTIQNQQRFFSFIARLLNYWRVVVVVFFSTRQNIAAPLAARRERRDSCGLLLAGINGTHFRLGALPVPLACVPGITAPSDYRSMDGPSWYFWVSDLKGQSRARVIFIPGKYGRRPVSSLLTVGWHWCLGGP